MPTVEKVGGGRVRVRGIGHFEVGDRAAVSEADAAYLCEERGDFERVTEDGDSDGDSDDAGNGDDDAGDSSGVEPPFDPREFTVDELRDELDDGDYGGSELHALGGAEADGKDRETAHEAIEAHIPDGEEA